MTGAQAVTMLCHAMNYCEEKMFRADDVQDDQSAGEWGDAYQLIEEAATDLYTDQGDTSE